MNPAWTAMRTPAATAASRAVVTADLTGHLGGDGSEPRDGSEVRHRSDARVGHPGQKQAAASHG